MAEVGLAFLSASLSVLFDRMASPEVLHFLQGRKPTKVLLRKLKTAMLPVNAMLADAEEKQLTNPSVKDWVDELKDVIYDAEDILDEIATEALQRKLQDAESSTTAEKVLACISNTFLDTFVNEVESKIEEVLDRLEDLTNQKNCLGLHEVVGAQEKQYPEGPSTSYVSQSDTFGRDEDKKKVIDLLLSPNASGNEMFVIAIVGMGGIGKTTLAQLAYNDSRMEQHFNLKIWFCVSEEFDELKIEKSIIEAATSTPCPNYSNPEQLRVEVRENLNGKKFLLVLDDVWSEKPKHREFLGQLLQYGTRGSRVLVTTRNDSVASAMHAIATHHLKLLRENDCWSLFEKHAFRGGSSNANPKIKEIGTQIVKKCQGLPLAIKAVGDVLGSKSDHAERYWTTILKSNLWDIPMETTNIIPALWLSYKYLPSNLKRCFAYCSIFSKGYLFTKDKLVLLWMAEGFLPTMEEVGNGYSMEEVGNDYFDDLVSRSLFQRSNHLFEPRFVMHDLVNDLAKSVTGKFGLTMEFASSKEIGEMTRYLSCFSVNSFGYEKIEKLLFKAKQLRTILVIDSSMGRSSPFNDYWKKNEEDLLVPADSSIGLRVLSLPNRSWGMIIKSFDFSKMKHLRYLDFSFTTINRLPDSICMLCNLQTLKLSCCSKLDKWPRDMWKLINLCHLEFEGSHRLEEMPIHIGRLKYLQTLTKFVVSKHDSGSSIEELGKLINLRGKLSIQEFQNVRSAKDASLKTKGYLEKLVLEWNRPKEVFGISKSQRDVLEDLQPQENLKSLTLKCYGGNGFPNWIGQGLPSLLELKLIDCKYCSALPPLGHLPFLNELHIVGLDGVATVGLEFYGNSSNSSTKPFGSLKVLRLKNMSNWENWLHSGGENEVETFSQLEELYIENCPKLRAKLPVHPSSLAKLEIINCKCELPMHWQYSSLEELLLRDCCDSVTSFPLDLFPNLKSIRIGGSNNLQSLEQHRGDLGLPSLLELKLIDCKYCSALPPLGHLPFLNKLHIFGLDGVATVGPEFYGNSSNSSMKPFGSLKVLRLHNMSNWENWLHSGGENEVETFSQLEELYIENCPKLRAKLPIHPSSLAKLEIINCQCELPMHRQYSSLEELLLRDCCDSVTSFPLDLFPNLKSIRIVGSNNLQSLEQHGGDLVISKLRISECPKLVDFPKGGLHAPNLASFIINDCESLRSMPDKMHIFLPSLCYLELKNCPEVESFPEGGLPSNLKQILICRCKKLIANWKGWGLQIHPSLKWLGIGGYRLEDHVESFSGGLLLPTTLTNLGIYSFGNLKSLDKEGFQHLTSLAQLVIFNCPKLRYMPEEGFPTSLCHLWVQSCPVLKKELERKEGEEWLKVARIPSITIDYRQIQGVKRLPAPGKMMRSPYEPPWEFIHG